MVFVSAAGQGQQYLVASSERTAENHLRRLEAIQLQNVERVARRIVDEVVRLEAQAPVKPAEVERIDDEVEQIEPFDGSRALLDTRIFPVTV